MDLDTIQLILAIKQEGYYFSVICTLSTCFGLLRCRRESYETAQSTAMEGDFSYPDPLACAEGPSEFHKRIAVLQQCVQDTRKWELYHKRILSQGTPAPSLLPTSYGSRVHSLHRAMSHVDGSTSSTDLVESTDKKRHKRPVLRRGISLPDMVVAADLSSNQDRIVLSHPSGRSVRTGSSAAEQVHVSTCTAAQLCKSSSAHNEREVKAALSAEKTVKKRCKPVLAASDKVDQLPPSTMGNTVEECVQPPTPAPPIAKQTRKKHSYSRPTSAKLVHKSKPAKKQPRTQSAK